MSMSKEKKGKKYVGDDRNGKPLYIGDEVMIEQAWEDEAGYYHDEQMTIARIIKNGDRDGELRFRIGHWKTRKARDQKIQAWINQFEWYPKDVEKITL